MLQPQLINVKRTEDGKNIYVYKFPDGHIVSYTRPYNYVLEEMHKGGVTLDEYTKGRAIYASEEVKDDQGKRTIYTIGRYTKGKRIRDRTKSHYMKYYCKHCGSWFGEPQKCSKCKAFQPLRRVEYKGGKKLSSVDVSQIPEDELTEEEQRFLFNKETADKLKKKEHNLTRSEKRRLAAAARKAAGQTTQQIGE